MAMDLIVKPSGFIRCVYGEVVDLALLGRPTIVRASSVEPDQRGHWWVNLRPVGGPTLGPFSHRSQALASEQQWLAAHWLPATQ